MARARVSSHDARAKRRLRALFPAIGPWTSVALWHGSVPLAPAPATSLADEIDVICEHRLAGLLLRYLRESGTQVDPRLLAQLQRVAFARTSRSFAVASAGTAVISGIADAGTPCLVSKGPGIARLYPTPDCRPYGDIDVLVPPQQFASVVRDLEARGWREETRNVQPWEFFRVHCREGLNLVLDDGVGSLDVHHRAPPWIWSRRFDVAAMVGRAELVTIGGVSLQCLSAVDNLMIVALHLVSDRNAPGQTLIVWRDLVELARAVPAEDIVPVAVRFGLSGWLRAVLQSLPGQLDVADLVQRLPDDPVPAPLRLSWLLSPRAERLGLLASQFLRLPLPNGIAYVVGMLVPSRAFVRRKHPDTEHPYRAWWAHRGIERVDEAVVDAATSRDAA